MIITRPVRPWILLSTLILPTRAAPFPDFTAHIGRATNGVVFGEKSHGCGLFQASFGDIGIVGLPLIAPGIKMASGMPRGSFPLGFDG